jgi:tungstate transport system ATP-binding protein
MSAAPAPVFEALDLQVIRGGALILNIPSFVVGEGQIVVLIGPNGAGKSTLLQTLASLLRPARGQILFRGRRIGVDIPLLAYRRHLAMVLQEPLLFDTSVYLNVASGLKLRGLKKKHYDPLVRSALERFGIAGLAERSALTLSGGEARRVSIARAFATNPQVLLLDEPFSALDPVIRETLLEDLERVLRETRTTTVFVTHDRSEALRLATQLGVMHAGTILQVGSVSEVINRPVDDVVASLVGVETILKGEVIRSLNGTIVAVVAGRSIVAASDAAPGTQVSLCIRPEHVHLACVSPAGPARPKNTFAASVAKITPAGFYQKVQLDCGFPLIAYVPGISAGACELREGAEVSASVEAVNIHVIRHGGPHSV